MTLADRIEQAEGPNRELDREIALLLDLYDQPEDLGCFVDPAEAVVSGGGQTFAPEAYTSSIDAAMTLVPEGCTWTVTTNTVPPSAVVWTDDVSCVAAEGATPALALCAAALRARKQAQAQCTDLADDACDCIDAANPGTTE